MSRYGGGGYGSGGSNPYASNGYGGDSAVNPYGDAPASTNPYGGSTTSVDRYGAAPASSNPYGDSAFGASATSLRSDNPYGGSGSAPPSQPQSLRGAPNGGGFQPRNRRQGGYGAGAMSPPAAGGFDRPGPIGSIGSREDIPEDSSLASVNRPTSLERSQAKRRSGPDRRSPIRRNGTAPGSQQIEDVLKHIQRDWDFMTEEKCIPVEVALKLMDDSSLGLARRNDQFKDIHYQLQSSLRVIVNEHHQGFNSSIGTFHNIQTAIQNSQTRLRTLRDSLVTAKGSLSSTKPELKGLATRSQEFDDMLRVLSSIERLQDIPEKLEARISEKRFLSAVELLQEGLKTIRNSEMDNIGALSDLRVYLSNQEHSLTDIMIEELHNHLYLKSPYCENRWKQYAPHAKASMMNGTTPPVGGRVLYQFLDKMDMSKALQDEPAKNPEADSFMYVRLIIESLNSLGRLDSVVESITHRLPVELFKVVEKSTNEADQRHPASLRGKKTDALDGSNNARSIVLNDLLGTLFARFEAIAEGHRVVHEVISGLLKREGMRSSSALTGGFRELWKLYQSEIRSLLHDYLAADGQLGFRSGDGSNRPGSVFAKLNRDKNKSIFRLNNMDNKSSDMNSEREDLETILKTSVPGLVSDSKRPNLLNANAANGLSDGAATGHKLLVDPSVFNMGILLPPSLTFLARLKEVVPPTSDISTSTLTSFLDDFLVNVFLPQLEETLSELCVQTFIDSDAFQQDPTWSSYSRKPILKGTIKFFRLITAFCRMLDALPHDQAFSLLVISQITTYYDKCNSWYKAVIARAKPHSKTGRLLKMSASLLDVDAEFKEAVIAMVQAPSDPIKGIEDQTALLDKETQVLSEAARVLGIEEADLILDRRNITALCSLHTSMKWLAAKVAAMRRISTEAVDSSRRESRQTSSRRWTLITNSAPVDAEKVFLPLNEETAKQFDAAVDSYRQLANATLRLLRVEVRCHVLHYIEKALKRPMVLDTEVGEPDSEVVALNADLLAFDEVLGACLVDESRSKIITPLSPLLTSHILSSTPQIPILNTHGAHNLSLTILVLQQNLKNIESSSPSSLPDLRLAAQFFTLFTSGSEEIVRRVKKEGKGLGYGLEQVRELLRLVYSEGMASERREVVVAAERGFAGDELAVSEFLW